MMLRFIEWLEKWCGPETALDILFLLTFLGGMIFGSWVVSL